MTDRATADPLRAVLDELYAAAVDAHAGWMLYNHETAHELGHAKDFADCTNEVCESRRALVLSKSAAVPATAAPDGTIDVSGSRAALNPTGPRVTGTQVRDLGLMDASPATPALGVSERLIRTRVRRGEPGWHELSVCDGGYEPHVHLRSQPVIVYARWYFARDKDNERSLYGLLMSPADLAALPATAAPLDPERLARALAAAGFHEWFSGYETLREMAEVIAREFATSPASMDPIP